jgi:hypothetical protein
VEHNWESFDFWNSTALLHAFAATIIIATRTLSDLLLAGISESNRRLVSTKMLSYVGCNAAIPDSNACRTASEHKMSAARGFALQKILDFWIVRHNTQNSFHENRC